MNIKKPVKALRRMANPFSFAQLAVLSLRSKFAGAAAQPKAVAGKVSTEPARSGAGAGSLGATPSPRSASRASAGGRTDLAPSLQASAALDEDAEMRGNSPIAAARNRERARCQAIMSCEAAAKNPQLAACLAFKDRMPRKEAIALLETMPATVSADPRNLARAARNPRVGAGGEVHNSPQQAAVTRMSAAMAAESKKAFR